MRYDTDVERTEDSYVFTASSPASEKRGDNGKHVSLAIKYAGAMHRGLPRLITKKWVNGPYFLDDHSQSRVVLAWPPSMTEPSTADILEVPVDL